MLAAGLGGLVLHKSATMRNPAGFAASQLLHMLEGRERAARNNVGLSDPGAG